MNTNAHAEPAHTEMSATHPSVRPTVRNVLIVVDRKLVHIFRTKRTNSMPDTNGDDPNVPTESELALCRCNRTDTICDLYAGRMTIKT